MSVASECSRVSVASVVRHGGGGGGHIETLGMMSHEAILGQSGRLLSRRHL